MLLRFRRHNTADQGSDEASERPRRGIDTGNHYEFLGGTVTIGARGMPPAVSLLSGHCIPPAASFASDSPPLASLLSQSSGIPCMYFTLVEPTVTVML